MRGGREGSQPCRTNYILFSSKRWNLTFLRPCNPLPHRGCTGLGPPRHRPAEGHAGHPESWASHASPEHIPLSVTGVTTSLTAGELERTPPPPKQSSQTLWTISRAMAILATELNPHPSYVHVLQSNLPPISLLPSQSRAKLAKLEGCHVCCHSTSSHCFPLLPLTEWGCHTRKPQRFCS